MNDVPAHSSHILVTGGTGFIGHALCALLLESGHAVTVLSRQSAPEVRARCGQGVAVWRDLSEWQPDTRIDAVINLAGAPILDWPWTAARKRTLWQSRVALTRHLVARIAAAVHKPAVLLSGSAIGYYGEGGDARLEENAAPGDDFGAQLCQDWEAAALAAEQHGVRICLLRTGLVLHPSGGLLQRMRLPFKFGLGAQLGDGQQWMSWIHRNDYLSILLQLLSHPQARGPYNLTAPHPVSNAEFTHTLAEAVHSSAMLTMPAWLLKALLGERAPLLLGSQRVLPSQVEAMGYAYLYPHLDQALSCCATRRRA